MAGKVQHEIPQLYQRGFQIPSTDGKEQIYVYRRGGKPFISAINRSGAQSYFYSVPSKDGSRTLYDEITDYERHLTTLVKELRTVKPDEQANATSAAEVIAHLTTRNAHHCRKQTYRRSEMGCKRSFRLLRYPTAATIAVAMSNGP